MSTPLNRLRRFPLQGTTPAARQSRFRGVPGRGCASRTSPEWLVRFAHLAGVGLPHSSRLTSHKGTARRATTAPPHSSPLTSHQGQPQGLPLRPSRLTPHTGTARRAPTAHPLTPTTSILTPQSSLLPPHSSPLTPHPSFLTCIKLAPEAVGTLALCDPPRCNPLPPLRWPPPIYRLYRLHRLCRIHRLYRLRHPCHPTAMKP